LEQIQADRTRDSDFPTNTAIDLTAGESSHRQCFFDRGIFPCPLWETGDRRDVFRYCFGRGDPNNPNEAATAEDSVGMVATYTYDSSSRLTKLSYPDGSALNFTNHPYSSMTLSVTDSRGKLLESHTYDAQDRGLTSSRAYGVDSVSLSY